MLGNGPDPTLSPDQVRSVCHLPPRWATAPLNADWRRYAAPAASMRTSPDPAADSQARVARRETWRPRYLYMPLDLRAGRIWRPAQIQPCGEAHSRTFVAAVAIRQHAGGDIEE